MSTTRRPNIEILTFSTLFPNSQQPNHGIFVENRLRHLVASQSVASRVVAPVPWFPHSNVQFGRYGRFARIPAREDRGGLEVHHPKYLVLPKIGMTLAPRLLFAASLPLLKTLQRERDFDVIDAHYFYPDGVAAAWLGRKLNKPVVITARGTDVNLIPTFRLPRGMILKAAQSASGIVAVSEALKGAITALGVPDENVTVLRNGVDLRLFRPSERDEARRNLGLTGPTLLSVGHLIERKGHDLVINALPMLPGFMLVIVGEGPELGPLERVASRVNVRERVRFLGRVPHTELYKVYCASDALVLASSREGWPNVLLEAMACGTPVIASDVWGNPEVVSQPSAGVLMQERTAVGVAEAVNRLFHGLPDRAMTRRYAEQFSWDATSEGQMRLFERIASK